MPRQWILVSSLVTTYGVALSRQPEQLRKPVLAEEWNGSPENPGQMDPQTINPRPVGVHAKETYRIRVDENRSSSRHKADES